MSRKDYTILAGSLSRLKKKLDSIHKYDCACCCENEVTSVRQAFDWFLEDLIQALKHDNSSFKPDKFRSAIDEG